MKAKRVSGLGREGESAGIAVDRHRFRRGGCRYFPETDHVSEQSVIVAAFQSIGRASCSSVQPAGRSATPAISS
jgi:hypothetical protein